MCECNISNQDSCGCTPRPKKDTPPWVLDVKWPHGHVTSDGRDAKYLGPGYIYDEYNAWLIDGKVLMVSKNGTSLVTTIKNKPAPSKKRWVNLYFDKDNKVVGGMGRYSDKQEATQYASPRCQFLGAVEIGLPI